MKRTLVGLSAIALVSVSACSAGTTTESGTTDKKTTNSSETSSKTTDSKGDKDDNKAVTIVAAISPLAYLAEEIGGDKAKVINLTKPGTSPHDVEIEPKTMAEITKATAFFYLGGKFQTSVDKVATGDAKKIAFDIADAAKLEKSEHGHDDHGHGDHDDDKKKKTDDKHDHDRDKKKKSEDGHDHDHDDDKKKKTDDKHDHDHDHDKKKSTSTSTSKPKSTSTDKHDHDDDKKKKSEDGHDHGHDHGGLDPHFWLDPVRMADVAEAMVKHMAKVDPDNADDYKANGKKVAKALDTLNESYETKLKPCKNRTIVSGHETYMYMAKRYKMKQLGIGGLSPDSEPKPQEMVKIAKFIKKNKVTTIYADKAASPALAKTLASETGAKMAVLNETGTTGSGNDYINAMEENLATLVKHQDCN